VKDEKALVRPKYRPAKTERYTQQTVESVFTLKVCEVEIGARIEANKAAKPWLGKAVRIHGGQLSWFYSE
jgi:hypothetical protein